jgi:tripartite-type tricarboxylate transporter receptor subunit TctC
MAGAAAAVAVLSVSLSSHGAWAQATRAIKIVVPFTAGGPNDLLARLMAEQIGRVQGLTIVVENRPGAGAAIGTEAVAPASPDGNTVLITGNSFVINPHLRKVNFDPLTSFEPICRLASAPIIITVNSASPYHTLADLLTAAHGKRGGVTLASLTGGPFEIAFEMLKRTAKVELTFVPFGGTAPAVNALLGGHVASALVNYSVVTELLNAGKLRAIATFSRERNELQPDVPTVAESGYKDIEAEGWFGLFAPAKTPKEAVSQLAGSFTGALQIPEVKAKLAVQGLYPAVMCGADFAALIRKQYDENGRVIREANIKAE